MQNGNPVVMAVPFGAHIDVNDSIDATLAAKNIPFSLLRQTNGWASEVAPVLGRLYGSVQTSNFSVQASQDRRSLLVNAINAGESLYGLLATVLTSSTYIFRAERLNVGESNIDANSELAPDAGNLPSVLLQLPRNASAYQVFIERVREVFPTIYSVAATPISSNRARISVTMNHSVSGIRRPGIEIPLADCGTGLSQVLALLYVAITAPASRIIVIDEPNSFLHPGAAKKVLTILRSYDHQYIISTHSAEIIRTLEPEYVHLIEWNGVSSAFQTMDSGLIADQRRMLTELGVRLSDIFGSDNVLWVEGQTEAVCFPLLMEFLKIVAPATAIVPLIATGDLEAVSKGLSD